MCWSSDLLALSPVVLTTLVVIGDCCDGGGASMVAITPKCDLVPFVKCLLEVSVYVGRNAMAYFCPAIAVYPCDRQSTFVLSIGSVILTTNNQDGGGLWSRMPATTALCSWLNWLSRTAAARRLLGFTTESLTFKVEQPWIVGVLLLVNGLTALNLTRVFRLVLGQPS